MVFTSLAIEDPRPDLPDTELWTRFLNMAMIVDEQLAYILHGFRCSGLRLYKIRVGYVMRPEFNKDSLWLNQKEYDVDKVKWLVKYQEEIVDLLNRLGGTS